MAECPACGNDSDVAWKCDECGKPFEGDEPESTRSALGGAN